VTPYFRQCGPPALQANMCRRWSNALMLEGSGRIEQAALFHCSLQISRDDARLDAHGCIGFVDLEDVIIVNHHSVMGK